MILKDVLKEKEKSSKWTGEARRWATPQKGGGIYIQKQNAQNSTVRSKKCM